MFMSPNLCSKSQIDWSEVIDKNCTCNANMNLILAGIVFAFAFSSCLTKDHKELLGNLLMVAGQIIITTAL